MAILVETNGALCTCAGFALFYVARHKYTASSTRNSWQPVNVI
jgi:hypothetical protein